MEETKRKNSDSLSEASNENMGLSFLVEFVKFLRLSFQYKFHLFFYFFYFFKISKGMPDKLPTDENETRCNRIILQKHTENAMNRK